MGISRQDIVGHARHVGHACAAPPGRVPLHCVMPPHILESIARSDRSSKNQRARAIAALSLTHSLSAARIGYSASVQSSLLDELSLPGRALVREFAAGQTQRTIHTADNTQRVPGKIVRREGDPPVPGDPAVNEAYDYMGDTYDFYWQVFGRDSVDDEGLALHGTVHFDEDYDNAFWDGQRMIYGDGDQAQFERFTKSIDVIAHELTHGVTQYSPPGRPPSRSGLIYWGQPGALNESISDVFGTLVKQWQGKQTVDEADWLIGQDLFVPHAVVNGRGIRDMRAPGTAYGPDPVLGTDPQPADMSGYQFTLQDNGGVHINSGIPNRAFYLAAAEIGGYAWEKAGAIWYSALQSPLLRTTTQFGSFARLTVLMAQQLYPGGHESQAVRNGWAGVGINV
jgi:Zn-dependent metalloprotease